MKFLFPILVLVSLLSSQALNERPIIGIWDAPSGFPDQYPESEYNFISATNVKWLESSGARVVPIHFNREKEYYDWMFERINGLFFPGGATDFTNSSKHLLLGDPENPSIFIQNANYMMRKAMKAYDNGDYFPIYGICLGFEVLNFVISGYDNEIITPILEENDVARTTQFTDIAKESRLYQNLPSKLEQAAETEAISYYFHSWTIRDSAYEQFPILNETYKILSHSQNPQGDVYIDAIEARNYPIYGHQFHPEKALFEWVGNIPHTLHSTQWGIYHGTFFVNEAKNSKHKFDNEEQEQANLIYQYSPDYMMPRETQDYFFKNNFA